jgi:glycosyltransferase involved in cell wall biosynthesis
MNILIVNWRDIRNPEAGGAEIHLHEIGSRWVKMGHCVTLLCSAFSGSNEEETIEGITVKRVGNKFSVYFRALQELVKTRSNYDVVLESINTVPFFTPSVSGIPVVAQIYSIENRMVLFREARMREYPLAACAYLASTLIPKVYSQCNIVTISRYAKDILVKRGIEPSMVHVAYPGISDEFHEILDKSKEVERPNHNLVYLGRLKKYKGVQDIIAAVAVLRKRFPDIHLSIMGKGDYEEKLKKLVLSLGLQEHVSFLGFVSESRKAEVLKSSSLFICTSVDEGGWTISAVEAMAAAVPILVTNSQRDLISDKPNGVLLSSPEPSYIAQVVYRILSDPELWKNMSRNALDYSKLFSWDNTSSTTLKVLGESIRN